MKWKITYFDNFGILKAKHIIIDTMFNLINSAQCQGEYVELEKITGMERVLHASEINTTDLTNQF